ncbi:MAG: preprotein translocase subunit SecE [Rickettsiales bacterium]|nr:preprotein translocase subunit SecE [Rickettsiales bacterium]
MFKKAIEFFGQVKEETAKVVWPTKRETVTGSVMIFVFSLAFALFFFVVDRFFMWMLGLIFNF